MKKEIINILTRTLKGNDRTTIYCPTCVANTSENGSRCEYCNRKMMGWGISNEYAEEIASEILSLFIPHQ
ncbi:MAG: hypothetical protein K0S76_471 [Herbinix sp.]|jgi:hypothetical protein|nr:hypothetical protein [Herbinix sp.]